MAFTKIAAAGIGSTELVTLHSLEVLNNATVGGVLTYEDVTNVDSIGIITARAGVLVGSGITLSKDGDIFATGISTFSEGVAGVDTFKIETSGSERLRIDSAGRVLIGGTSAIIASDSEFNEIVLTGKTRGAGITLQDTDANTRFQIRTDDAGGDPQTLLNASTNHPITIRTNNTERVRLTAAGNVVTQGLTGASYNDDGSNSKVLEVTGDGTVGEYGILNLSGNQNSDDSTIGAIKFINRENSNTSSGTNASSRALGMIDVYSDTGDSNAGDDCGGYMRFVTKADGGSNVERLRITSGGVKQIKNGNLNISSTYIDFSGDVSTPSTAAAIFRPADNTLAFSTLNAERARIDSGGDFGVGLTNPTAKLHAQDDSATETTILKLRNYKSSVNTKPSLSFEASTSSGQGATSTIQGLAGTDAGGSNSQNDSGMKFIVRHGGSGTEREAFSIKTDGNIHFPNGQGIDFSATSDSSGTMTSELLDDYEEGTWTPALTFGGGSTGITYGGRGGTYTKIGRQVSLNFMVELTSKGSSTGDAIVGGLPYTVTDSLSNTVIEASGAASYWNNIEPDLMFLAFSAHSSSGLVPRFQPETGASDAVDSLDDANFTNTTNFRGSITYFTT